MRGRNCGLFLILLNEYIFFQIVVDDYAQSFRDVLSFEKSNPKDPKVLKEFSEAVHKVRERHTNTVIIMAEAVMEMKNNAQRHGQSNGTKQPKYMENIQYFLDRLYISRISTRMLINQHTALFTELDKVNTYGYLGGQGGQGGQGHTALFTELGGKF
jgi:hypothetical protein